MALFDHSHSLYPKVGQYKENDPTHKFYTLLGGNRPRLYGHLNFSRLLHAPYEIALESFFPFLITDGNFLGENLRDKSSRKPENVAGPRSGSNPALHIFSRSSAWAVLDQM